MKLQRDHHEELRIIDEEKTKKDPEVPARQGGRVVILMDPESGDVILKKKGKLTAEILKRLSDDTVRYIILSDPDEQKGAGRRRAASEGAESKFYRRSTTKKSDA
jgi:DNA-directed RNA polymerase subunit beta